VPTGDDWVSATDPAVTNFPDLSIPPEYCSGSFRVVAMGYEVVNTTAELYKGGSVTAYRSPNPITPGVVYTTTYDPQSIQSQYLSTPVKFGVIPPTNLPDAALYPNSKTWGATEGIYQIATQNSMNNDFISPVPSCAGLLTPSDYTDLENGVGWVTYLPPMTSASGLAISGISSLTQPLPFDISGCIFAGLSPETSLQVTVRYYFERNPGVSDPNLLVLARPPAAFDPTALEIYSRALDELPVACRFGDNPIGEWFSDVLKAIGDYAPIIGDALGNVIPGAGAIGKILGAGARGANKLMPAAIATTTTTTGKGKNKKTTKTETVRAMPVPRNERRGRIGPVRNRADLKRIPISRQMNFRPLGKKRRRASR